MEFSILIPSYNRNAILYKHLALAYDQLHGLDYEIIVINDSKENSIIIEENWSDKIRCVNNPKQGVASARNLGASLAQSDILIFMDDDMMLNRNAVLETLAYLQQKGNENKCLNVNWIYPMELSNKIEQDSFGRYLKHIGFTSLEGWMDGEYGEWKENNIIQAKGVTSQFLAMSKQSFIRSGGYNENFPFAGYEDYDYSMKLEREGIVAYLHTGIMIQHNEEDRVMLDSWLQRKYRGGHTRRVAANMGYNELKVDYKNVKGYSYFLLSKMEFILWGMIKRIPNKKVFDPLYFRIVNILLGLNSYKGYTK